MLETQDCSMHGSATSLHRQVAKSAPNRAAGRRGAGASQRFHGRRPADFILRNQPARGIQSRRKSTGILPCFPPYEQSCAKSAIRYLQEGPVKRAPRRKMGTGGSQGIKRKTGTGKQDFLAQVNRTCAVADKTNQARAQKEQKKALQRAPDSAKKRCAPRYRQKSQQSEEKNRAFPPMLSCHATSLSGWAVPGSPATFSRPDQASCRKKKAQKAKSRKSARPPCGNCHTRIFLMYAFRKAGAFCESIISACDVTADPRQKKPQQALSEPGSAAVGRSMAFT